MAQLYCTGPAHVFVGVPNGFAANGKTAFYLGTCEDSPRVTLRPAEEAVFNALTGTKIPFDKSFQGEEAFIGLDLTRYNSRVLNLVRKRSVWSATPAATPGPGVFGSFDLGTLALTEGAAFTCWLVFPYQAKAVMNVGGMPAGYRFIACTPVGPEELGPLGTRARKEHVMLHAIMAYNPVTGQKLLYDDNLVGLPAVD
jgi:hypothetical protein